MSGVILNAHLDRKKTRQVVKGDLISETEYKGEIELRVGRDRGGWRVWGVSRKLWKKQKPHDKGETRVLERMWCVSGYEITVVECD